MSTNIKNQDGTLTQISSKVSSIPALRMTNSTSFQDSPVGEIINYDSDVAPEFYLKCDGSIYNIADYPELTQYFLDTYGAINHFGGDGITTFAVPSSQGGGSGMPDPTNENKVLVSNEDLEWEEHDWSEKQNTIPTYTRAEYEEIKDSIPEGTLFNLSDDKINVSSVTNNVYSTNETIIGTWINGKPIYRKVIAMPDMYRESASKFHNSEADISSIMATCDKVVSIDGVASCVYNGTKQIFKLPNTHESDRYCIKVVIIGSLLSVAIKPDNNYDTAFTPITDIYVTIEYTKTTD